MTILEGSLCRLRPWCEADVDALPAVANSKAIWRNVRDVFPHPYTREAAEWWVGHCMSGPPSGFVRVIEVDGALAGAVGIEWRSGEQRHAGDVGYWLGERYWSRGIATEALGLISEWGFAQPGIQRMAAEVFSWNTASMRVLEKCGYEKEAALKHAVQKDGEFGDAIVYARVFAPS